MTDEEQISKKPEQQVVILKDFKQYEQIIREYRCGDVFFCPKCESSIICLCEEYNKNNIMNSMNPEDSKSYSSQDFKKIVLQCGNCQYKDILIKFLKTFERKPIEAYGDELLPPIKRRKVLDTIIIHLQVINLIQHGRR